jgi:ATP-dependent NAD(P)H-hydrate dehydratase
MTHLVDKVGSLLQSAQLASQQPSMSASSKAMLAKVRKLVPPMLEKFHKGRYGLSTAWQALLTATGQLGRVAVVGGSKEYAPTWSP